MKKFLPLLIIFISILPAAYSQNCNPQGNQTNYGSNNVWIGYVYNNVNFSSYKGYITRGTTNNPNFDTDFGGSNSNFNTAGCQVQTETFSVRFKLNKTVSNGTYKITVGGDDGYRLSLDGGNTWVINAWDDHVYQTSVFTLNMSGTYNMVLEYYENSGDNRVSFSMAAITCGSQNTETYGSNNKWNGYLYTGTSFNNFAGMVTKGNPVDASFTEGFGGSDVYFNAGCSYVRTEKFSARYRLNRTFANGIYTFGVGADDGYRLSIDGGLTWLINRWDDHSYITSSATVRLNGTYKLVLEYYENGGENLLNFFVQNGTVLANETFALTGREQNGNASLAWDVETGSNAISFDLEKSSNGTDFTKINTLKPTSATSGAGLLRYTSTDKINAGGSFYYRIKMTGADGKTAWSNTILLRSATQSEAGIKIYPTVVTNATIQLKSVNQLSNTSIIISDLTGKTISSRYYGKITANQPTSITIGNGYLPAGVYMISIVEADQKPYTQRITIL